MSNFKISYVFDLVDRFSGKAGAMSQAALAMSKNIHTAGNAANAMASSAGKIGAAMKSTATAAASAQRALAGYANAAENAAFRAAAASRVAARDAAFMGRGYKRAADGGWITPGGPGKGDKGMDRTFGGFAMMGALSYLSNMGQKLFDTNIAYQEEMNNARALMTKSSQEDFQAMEEAALQWGRNSVFSAVQVAKAFGQLGAIGYEARQAMEVMGPVLQMAQASRVPLDRSAESLVAIKNQFGLADKDMEHISDVMAYTAGKTQANLTDMHEAFKMAGPISHMFGLDMETTSALIGALSQFGLKGSLAGTGLRRVEAAFGKQTKPAMEIFSKLGISPNKFFDKEGQFKDFIGLIGELEKKGITASQAMKAFGDRGGPILSAALETGSKALREFIDQLTGGASVGAAAAMAEKQMEGLRGAWARWQGALETSRISIGNSGWGHDMGFLLDRGRNLIQLFELLPDHVKRFVGWTATGVGALATLAMPIGLLAFSLKSLGLAGAALTGLRWLRRASGLGLAYELFNQILEIGKDGSLGLSKGLVDWIKNAGLKGKGRGDPGVTGSGVGKGRQGMGHRRPVDTHSDFDAAALPRRGHGRPVDTHAAYDAQYQFTPYPQPEKDVGDHMREWINRAGPGGAGPASNIPQSVAVTVTSDVKVNNPSLTVTYNGPIMGPSTVPMGASASRGTSTVESGAPTGGGAGHHN